MKPIIMKYDAKTVLKTVFEPKVLRFVPLEHFGIRRQPGATIETK